MSRYIVAGSGEAALVLNEVGRTLKVHCKLDVEMQTFHPEEDHEKNSMRLVIVSQQHPKRRKFKSGNLRFSAVGVESAPSRALAKSSS